MNLHITALQVEHDAFEHIRELLESFANVMEDEIPKTRAQARQAKKRKRSPSPETVRRTGNPILQASDSLMPTQLQELHLSDMEDAQIWAQLELRGQIITKVVEALFEGAWDDPMKALDEEDDEEAEVDSEVDELSMEGMDIDMENSSSDEGEGVEGFDLPDEAATEEQDDTSGDENMPEHITRLANYDEDEEPLLIGLDLDRPSPHRKGEPRPRIRHPTLDDDFFSIVNFNKEIEAAEAQRKGQGRLDEDSDEESIDLFQAVAEDDELADQEGHTEGGCMCIVLQTAWRRAYSYSL